MTVDGYSDSNDDSAPTDEQVVPLREQHDRLACLVDDMAVEWPERQRLGITGITADLHQQAVRRAA